MPEETMIHPETGELLRRDIRPREFNYKGETVVMDMPGWYPTGDGDAIFSRQDMEVHDKALDILQARHEKSLRVNLSA